MTFGPKNASFLFAVLTAFCIDHRAAEQNVYTQSLFGYRDMYYGANFTTGSLSDGEPVQPFTLTLWMISASLSVPYETLHGYCNTFEHYAGSQYTYVDDYGDGYYELVDSVAFYDNGSRLFYVDADVMAVSTVTTTPAVEVWTTNAFDGFFGIYTVLGDDLLPANQSVISVLLRRTCEDGYTANAGYITYGGIHPQCDILAHTPLDERSGIHIWDAPSIRILTIRHDKNTVRTDSVSTTLDSTEQNIILPKDVFQTLKLNATSTERGFTVDCDSRPEIALTFNGTSELVVTARQLMYKASDGRCYLQVTLPENTPTDPDNSANATFILGLPFLRQFCLALDWRNSKLGIGNPEGEGSKEICHYQTPLPALPRRQCAAMKRQIPPAAASGRPPVLPVLALLAVVVSLSS